MERKKYSFSPVQKVYWKANTMTRLNKQRGVSDAAFMVLAIVIFVLVWLGGPADNKNKGPSSGSIFSFVSPGASQSVSSSNQPNTIAETRQSQWEGKVSLSRGNAKSEYTPSREYITIRLSTRAKESANISGWILENSTGEKSYQVGSEVVKGASQRVLIPYGSKLFLSTGVNVSAPVILEPGESATVVTGRVPATTPFRMQSFKVNKCSGYIEELKNVTFYPKLALNCPLARDYPEVAGMEKSCYDFLRKVSICHTPEFKDKRLPDGGVDAGAVDGVIGLTNQCKAFISTHLNYTSCVANHLNDDDFYTGEWRIFLNQTWEMWAKDRETISLYDSVGYLADSIYW